MSDEQTTSRPHEYAHLFTEATVIMAEGARVGIVTCKICGAAVLIDPRDTDPRKPGAIDPVSLHIAQHKSLEE